MLLETFVAGALCRLSGGKTSVEFGKLMVDLIVKGSNSNKYMTYQLAVNKL